MAGSGIIALDLSQFTGFAYWRPGMSTPFWDTWKLRKGSGPGSGAIMNDLWSRLEPRLRTEPPMVLYFEAPYIDKGSYNKKTGEYRPPRTSDPTARRLNGYAVIVETLCERFSIPTYETHSGEHRKHFCGRGQAPRNLPPGVKGRDVIKKLMVDTAWDRGYEVETDDEAEAISILYLAAWEQRKAMTVPFDCSPFKGELLEKARAA